MKTPSKKYYLILFLVYSLFFSAFSYLFLWLTDIKIDSYNGFIQGLFFGLYMTLYEYWTDRKRKKKDQDK